MLLMVMFFIFVVVVATRLSGDPGLKAGVGWTGAAPDLRPPVTERAGPPTRITDGDTIRLGSARIRLQGIDAPEMSTAEGRQARAHLRALIGSGSVRCEDTGQRSYDRVVAVCYGPDGRDLAMTMVAEGWALDLPRFSGGRYADAERRAARAGLGMHR